MSSTNLADPMFVHEKLAVTLGLDEAPRQPLRLVAEHLREFATGDGWGRHDLRNETVRYLVSLVPEIEEAIDIYKVDIVLRAKLSSRAAFMGTGWVGGIEGNIVSMATIIDDLGYEEELVMLTPENGKGRPLGHILHQLLTRRAQKTATSILRRLADDDHIRIVSSRV